MIELQPVPESGVFELRGERLPTGWTELRLEIAGALASAPRLLVDDGAGFSDATALVLPQPRDGRVQTVVELPRTVRRLALDAGGASLGRLAARELGAVETALRLAFPVVKRRFAEPWTIPISALRLARLLVSGELRQRLAQKEMNEEPQLWYERWYARFGELTDADRAAIRADAARLAVGFSGAIGDVGRQLYFKQGEWKLYLDPTDELTEHALYLLAREIAEHPEADFVYGDEDSVDEQGRLYGPELKPDWNPDLFLSTNYISRAFASRVGPDPLQAKNVRHVPFVILHKHGKPAPPATKRVRWPLPSQPLVSLIIPTRNGRALLETCIESLRKVTGYRNYEILVVDNQSTDPSTLDYLAKLERVLRYPHPFNFSAINNFAVAQARGEVVGLLNNDLEFVDPGWLEEMLSHALRPEIGCVGAKLLYPDRTVQHAGVVIGIGGIADHIHKNLPENAPGYCGRARLTQNFSGVTAACMLVRRKTYLDVGGFDEGFAVAFNDVDFCLRVRERGLRNVWTPYATVIHHESKSRGRENTLPKLLRFRGEMKRLKQRWGSQLSSDPAYNPNLTLDARNVSLAWPPRVRKPWR
ncbi:MAG: glycosyltransferase [Myxococcales bacterium]